MPHIRNAGHDATLGGQHHPVAYTRAKREHGSEGGFAGPEPGATPIEAVHIGIVDERHAQLHCRFHQFGCAARIGVGESPATEGQRPALATADVARGGIDQVRIDGVGAVR